jgi:hypothetical protein
MLDRFQAQKTTLDILQKIRIKHFEYIKKENDVVSRARGSFLQH